MRQVRAPRLPRTRIASAVMQARLDALAAQQPCADSAAAGTLIGTLPLSRADGVIQPYGVKFGGPGLDARQITDLSRLDPDRLITPNRAVFVRTERPPKRPRRSRSAHCDSGSTAREGSRRSRNSPAVTSDGHSLLECAGNNNPANFGLMSVAAWDGALLTSPVCATRGRPRCSSRRSRWAVASAAAVAGRCAARHARSRAFLALRMNGEPLPPDHGCPSAWSSWLVRMRRG